MLVWPRGKENHQRVRWIGLTRHSEVPTSSCMRQKIARSDSNDVCRRNHLIDLAIISIINSKALQSSTSFTSSEFQAKMFARSALRAVATNGANMSLTKTMIPKALVTGTPLMMFQKATSASVSAKDMSDKEVNEFFNLWNDALATLDPDKVAKRFAKDPILLPTISDTPGTDYDSIRAYFAIFLKRKPQGVLEYSKVIKGDDWALDAGIYEFTMGDTGDKVKARYTFLYKFEDGEWKIAHQHSSVMPEAFLG